MSYQSLEIEESLNPFKVRERIQAKIIIVALVACGLFLGGFLFSQTIRQTPSSISTFSLPNPASSDWVSEVSDRVEVQHRHTINTSIGEINLKLELEVVTKGAQGVEPEVKYEIKAPVAKYKNKVKVYFSRILEILPFNPSDFTTTSYSSILENLNIVQSYDIGSGKEDDQSGWVPYRGTESRGHAHVFRRTTADGVFEIAANIDAHRIYAHQDQLLAPATNFGIKIHHFPYHTSRPTYLVLVATVKSVEEFGLNQKKLELAQIEKTHALDVMNTLIPNSNRLIDWQSFALLDGEKASVLSFSVINKEKGDDEENEDGQTKVVKKTVYFVFNQASHPREISWNFDW